MLYRIIRTYFRIAMRLYYADIEIEGADRVPTSGPLLLLSNHPNALIDPLAAVMGIDRHVSLTAKHTLARMSGIGWLMRTVGVVTFHRQQDVGDGASMRDNLATFREIHSRLAAGGAVLIFPEGITHSEPRLSRFKRGTARIALSYIEQGDAGGLVITPVGLTFEDPSRYRSRLHVRYGEPLRVAEWAAENGAGADDRALTRELMRRVGECTLQFESEAEAARLLKAAEIVLAGGRAPTTGRHTSTLGGRINMARRLQAGAVAVAAAGGLGSDGGEAGAPDSRGQDSSGQDSGELDSSGRDLDDQGSGRLDAGHMDVRDPNGNGPQAIDDLVARVDRYRERLDALGLSPSEVFLSLSPPRAARFVVRELAILIIGLPIAAFAVLVHGVPFLLTRLVARRFAQSEDQLTSGIIFSGFVAFPLTYLILAGLAFWQMPLIWAAAFVLVLLPSMAFTARYRSRLEAALRRSRTFLRFARDRELKAELADEGRDIDRRIRELAARSEGSNSV